MLNTIATFVTKWKTTLYAVAVALVLGLSGGWYISGKFDDAKRSTELARVIKNSKVSVDVSNKIQGNIIIEKAKTEIKYVTQIKEIIKYVPKTIYKQCIGQDGSTIDTTLNADAVRVLNNEPSDTIQPTSIDNAEVKTATEVGLRELSDYIITIKKEYKDLAIEHDGLIDYNNEYKALINQ